MTGGALAGASGTTTAGTNPDPASPARRLAPETADATSSAAIARSRTAAPSPKPAAARSGSPLTIRSFSSSVQRRRRPVSTTSRCSNTGLDCKDSHKVCPLPTRPTQTRRPSAEGYWPDRLPATDGRYAGRRYRPARGLFRLRRRRRLHALADLFAGAIDEFVDLLVPNCSGAGGFGGSLG